MAANENNPTNGLRKAALLAICSFPCQFWRINNLEQPNIFAWWLDKRIAKRSRKNLREKFENFHFFANYGAQVIPHDPVPAGCRLHCNSSCNR